MAEIIFLDLDGVVADFHLAALTAHGRPELYDNWPFDEYDIAKVLGITQEEFWGKLDYFDFWAEMPKTFYADQIVDVCRGKEVYFCTSAAQGMSASGKEYWIRHNYPDIGYVMTRHKHLLAGKGRLLIDDLEVNVRKFVAAGGRGVLVPAVHNGLRLFNPLATVMAAIK